MLGTTLEVKHLERSFFELERGPGTKRLDVNVVRSYPTRNDEKETCEGKVERKRCNGWVVSLQVGVNLILYDY